MHKKIKLLCCLLAACLLTSCALLPQEETVQSAPVVSVYERPAYQTAAVERGDLIQTAKINCSYVPVRTESLSFALDDEYIDRYFVQAGDHVEQGQLLAQLQLGDLESRIAKANSEAEAIRLQIAFEEKCFALDAQRLAITTEDLDPIQKEEAYQDQQDRYENTLRSLKDSLVLKELSIRTLEDELAKRQIRAPFSGAVIRVEKLREGDRSEFGSGVITLVDSTRSVFRASTEHWERFAAGDTCEVVVRKNPYQAVAADAEDLGLKPENRVPGKRGNVYFVLSEPAYELKDGDSGTVEFMLDARYDVLNVPADAVSEADGRPIVYCLREDGMKAWKAVEIGVTINGRTEILSGLVEGEIIVVK